VASKEGYFAQDKSQGEKPHIYICPNCSKPTYLHVGKQIPGVAPGEEVGHLPADVQALYKEARNAVAIGAPTAAVLACRKLLMNIAVSQGAQAGLTFVAYVEHLASSGYVPPNGRGWVDHIRKKGNEATHEIQLMTSADAEELIAFSEMLLKFIFEFPNRVPKQP
jgi:hypothetical protein